MSDMAGETTTIDPLPASGPAEAAEQAAQIRAGERVTDRYAEPEEAADSIDEAPLEPEAADPQATEPEQSPDYQAGFEAALEQLAEYDRYESEARQRDEMYEQLGEHLGLTGAQAQQLMEDQARQQILAQQQQQVASAEMQQRMASLHRERTEILDSALTRLESEVGEFDHEDVLAEARRIAQENPGLDPQAVLRTAAEASAAQFEQGYARIDDAIARVNRYVGADAEQVRRAAERAFDTSAEDQGAAVAEAIRQGFESVPKPVRLGTRVTDRYAELSHVHREMADPTPPPQPKRVQLQSGGQLRDAEGRFVRVERVTDRYRREAGEAEQEQRRLEAHQKLMRAKGLL